MGSGFTDDPAFPLSLAGGSYGKNNFDGIVPEECEVKLVQLKIEGQPRWYWLFHDELNLAEWELVYDGKMKNLESMGSSRFFWHPASGSLCKLAVNKYSPRTQFWRWLGRDVIERRWLGKVDALREWRSNRIMQKAGLKTVDCRAVGMAVNVCNSLGSFLAMEYLEQYPSAKQVLQSVTTDERQKILLQLAEDIASLAKHGYYHRDLHLNNFLYGEDGPIWIDTHIRSLPRDPLKASDILAQSLSVKKLLGEENHQIVSNALRQMVDWFD
ncbi:lipopolysaccharide kinase InaA family protein [Aeromonas fluvialis]|uniref:lipopolysaccharide kinase InaA family protein n=1 Tax=Aeromonas fluvialis TaxID=591962 RepID=UPI0005A72DF5|nr:lipopolysaccharide kinase InaA family protein [Aeromonas fluvialis]